MVTCGWCPAGGVGNENEAGRVGASLVVGVEMPYGFGPGDLTSLASVSPSEKEAW